jgi:hypothetical protein
MIDQPFVGFTKQEIELIVSSLPHGINRRRLQLLPRVLQYWAVTELAEHLSRPSRATMSARRQSEIKVGRRATALLEALGELVAHPPIERAVNEHGENGLFELALRMAIAEGKSGYRHKNLAKANTELENLRVLLPRITDAAAHTSRKRRSGQPRNIVAYLLLQDAVAIFQWATGTTATRRVDRGTGEEMGPFYEFATALWPVIFRQGDKGLPSAMKSWARARKKYGEQSPLLHNINLRHPIWRVFER